jgi:Tol biopolymer transport system component
MIARAVLAACVAACVSEPARPTCTEPRPLDEINDGHVEYAPRLSHDRKTLLFTAGAAAGGNTVYFVHRDDTLGPFGPRNQFLDSIPGVDRFDPVLSSDGATLWYLEGSGITGGDIYQASIDSAGKVGSASQVFPELGPVIHPTFTADMLQVFFSIEVSGDHDLFTAKRKSTSAPFEPAIVLDMLNTGGDDDGASISPDGETLYFASPVLGDDGNPHLRYATRAGNFADPHPLPAVPDVAGTADSLGSVHDDGATVAFARSDGPFTSELWIACE